MAIKNKFYITTTLPYVNADPHIGFALEIVQADCVARYQRSQGKEVFFNTGTDEHGQKIYQAALKEGKTPQVFCDEYAAKFDQLKEKLNLSYNNFIRTTDSHHIAAAQEFWKRCEKNGDIYKKLYKTKYCVGCELEKQDSDLIDGRCPEHPTREIEIREEENYFFRFSRYQKPLLDFYEKNPDFVVPVHRQKEIYNFVSSGLRDFSISRLKSKMPWGVAVPGDPEHVMYVWFDALVNYISCLGWPSSAKISENKPEGKFWEYWGTPNEPNAIQVAGKDNLRQQTAMWQAMLMSAGLPNSRQVLIHGFINVGGKKISKSAGKILPSPFELVDQYGIDGLRYFLLREVPATEDYDFDISRLKARYDADLADGLGNLVSRITNLAEKHNIIYSDDKNSSSEFFVNEQEYESFLDSYNFQLALQSIFDGPIRSCNQVIEARKPWAIEDEGEREDVIIGVLRSLKHIARKLEPFLPETSEKILGIFKSDKIVKAEPLFPKKS